MGFCYNPPEKSDNIAKAKKKQCWVGDNEVRVTDIF